jgi:tetratricopeptide (TPR) repeat protein
MVRKTALLWNDAEAFDTESQESYAQFSPVLSALSRVGRFGLLVPMAFVGLVLSWPSRHRLAIWYVLIASYALSVIMFFIYARYRFPLVPMLLPFAALALADGASRVRQLPRPRLAMLAASTIALAVFCWWPLLDRRGMLAVTEHNLGAALQAEGRLDDAVAHYRAATSANPTYAPAYSNLGTALFARGNVEEAFAAYRRAIEINPGFADAHFNYGNALLARDNAPAAIEQFRLALQATPNAPDVKTNLGIALLEAGRVDEGLQEITEASAIAPRAATIWRVLGEARAQAGQRDQALQALTRAAELAPDDPQVRQALERIRDSRP